MATKWMALTFVIVAAWIAFKIYGFVVGTFSAFQAALPGVQ